MQDQTERTGTPLTALWTPERVFGKRLKKLKRPKPITPYSLTAKRNATAKRRRREARNRDLILRGAFRSNRFSAR